MVDAVLCRYAQIAAGFLGILISNLAGTVIVQNAMLVGMHGKSIQASEPVAEDARIFCYAHLESGRTLR